MKRKKLKFSLGLKIASILSCLALVSIGFASWWIVKPPETKTTEGSFEVYAVSTKDITISAPEFAEGKADIIFGKADFPEGQTNHKWLLATDVGDENLTATMTFTVSVTDGGKSTGTSNVYDFLKEVKLTMTVPAALKTALTGEYVDATQSKITYTTVGGTEKSGEVAIDGTKDTVELLIDMSGATAANDEAPVVYSVDVTVTFAFAWGEQFPSSSEDPDAYGENPYIYFNKQAYTEDLAAKANNVLTALFGLNNTTYSVTLEGVLKG